MVKFYQKDKNLVLQAIWHSSIIEPVKGEFFPLGCEFCFVVLKPTLSLLSVDVIKCCCLTKGYYILIRKKI
jgi:hypothetical protein